MFHSFIQAGFECSTHKRITGQRLDLVSSTGHDRFAIEDFETLRQYGIGTVREGARWHLIESVRGCYDFGTLDVVLNSAADTGMEVVLDLLHFGWPDFLDVLSPQFVQEFGKFTSATARYLRGREQRIKFVTTVNEISFLAWGGGSAACINPYRRDCANELKANLVRAVCRASEVLLDELPGVRLVSTEPIINIVGDPDIAGDQEEAERYRLSQFEAWDMICGRVRPELGGKPEYLDVIGANFYDRNQWVNKSRTLSRDDQDYRSLRSMLEETWLRYKRPMFLSETGAEDEARAGWFNYVCDEVAAALARGIPMHGICLYPILNHPGWDDDRHCYNGLLDYADELGRRAIHEPLAAAIREQEARFQSLHDSASNEPNHQRSSLPLPSSMEFRFSTTTAPHESFCENEASVLF